MSVSKPTIKPKYINFSSGPCAKRPGWSVEALKNVLSGRSHRSKEGKARLAESIELMKEVLELPKDYRLGIVAGSDTGAVEMCLWSMLGQRGVDMFGWEAFSNGWISEVTQQLKLDNINAYKAPYGELPDLSKANFDNDVVFVWNGTTSGVCVPNGDWIPADRKGLTICDATSAVYAMEMPWEKLDVTTFSWQKALGGEAAHGVVILSPRAVERLESYEPSWPMPKNYRMTKGGKLVEGIFEGSTINTPSMLCVEDVIDSLNWCKSVGGLDSLIKRSKANLNELENWVAKTDWVEFLAKEKQSRSSTSICLSITADWFTNLDEKEQVVAAKKITALLDKEDVAKDINAYKLAPAGIRIWGGATIESQDVKALCPWLDWAYEQIAKEYGA